jgi:hypothetical protein
LLELSPEQGKGIIDRVPKIDGSDLLGCCGGNATQSSDEIVNPGNFLDYDLGEVFPEIDVAEALRKQLGKCADGDKWIFYLVRYPGGKGTERSQALRTLLLSLEVLQSTEIAEDNKRTVSRSVLVL